LRAVRSCGIEIVVGSEGEDCMRNSFGVVVSCFDPGWAENSSVRLVYEENDA
jgi:hypothetical protein